MDLFIKIAMFVTSLSLLILVHELGHFLTARMFGVRVEKFYLFFNPWFSLAKFRIGETEFGIGWLPLGGYCKISGMIDESMDTEQMKEPPKPYEFRSKPAWQRLIIMTGGVIMNVVLAVAIYAGMSYKWGDRYIANDDLRYGYVFSELGHEAGFRDGDRVLLIGERQVGDFLNVPIQIVLDRAPVTVARGDETVVVDIAPDIIARLLKSNDEQRGFMIPRTPFVVAGVMESGGAATGGVMAGDSLVAINGVPMMFFDEFRRAFAEHRGTTAELEVVRKGDYLTLPVEISDEGKIGVEPYSLIRFFPAQTHQYGLLASVPMGFSKAGSEIRDFWKQLGLIVSPQTEAYKSLGGFITIGSIFPTTWNWRAFWSITAFLSIMLAIINILPIPALDGGHVMFLFWEVVTGRKPSDKFMEYAQITGLILVFALILYANGNDIYRLFTRG
ncbi:MAG: RIP metalloprotease RseP [Rikenellaceae bacterium]|nr:RIP metalloprotease RseP [Rikenellaceae bacterium]MCL2693229.1 RIP metalloprotease RseP [Rikenellaceae bacterium]